MKIFYCDHFVPPLPGGHRFPMAKYRLLCQTVATAGWGYAERVEDIVAIHLAIVQMVAGR